MAGEKADAERFATKWRGKGDENHDTQLFWIEFYQNVLGVEDAISTLEFETPVATAASTHNGYIDVLVPSSLARKGARRTIYAARPFDWFECDTAFALTPDCVCAPNLVSHARFPFAGDLPPLYLHENKYSNKKRA